MYDQDLQDHLKALEERLSALEVIIAGMDAALRGDDPHPANCPSCRGSGGQWVGGQERYIPCYACDGTGELLEQEPPDLEEHERAIDMAIAYDEDELPF